MICYINGEPIEPWHVPLLHPNTLLSIATDFEHGRFELSLDVRSALAAQLIEDCGCVRERQTAERLAAFVPDRLSRDVVRDGKQVEDYLKEFGVNAWGEPLKSDNVWE